MNIEVMVNSLTTDTDKKFKFTFPNKKIAKNACSAIRAQFKGYSSVLEMLGVEGKLAIRYQETNEDGSPHIHVLLAFRVKFITRDPRVFDFIAGKHGNYATVRSLYDSIKYVRKENNYLEIGKVPQSLGGTTSKTSKSTGISRSRCSRPTLAPSTRSACSALHRRRLTFHRTRRRHCLA